MTRALGIAVQSRDHAILIGLLESRVMSLDHITHLFFEGKPEAARKRISKLKGVGLVGERPRKTYEPSVLFLTAAGFAALQESGLLVDYPILTWAALKKRAHVSDLTLRHELGVMDVRAAFTRSVGTCGTVTIHEFKTWPLFYQFTAKVISENWNDNHRTVKPDGFLRIHETTPQDGTFEHLFFLEVDRSTETLETLTEKASCYLDYYQSGGLARKYGRPASAYKEFPFRVLVVVANDERRNNLAERLLLNNPPIKTLVWISTKEEVLKNPFGHIWVRPKDFAEVVLTTSFQSGGAGFSVPYRRQSARESHVARQIRKQPLFDTDNLAN